MNENIRILLEKVESDDELKAKISTIDVSVSGVSSVAASLASIGAAAAV